MICSKTLNICCPQSSCLLCLWLQNNDEMMCSTLGVTRKSIRSMYVRMYFYYVVTYVLMYVEVVWLYCRSCMWTWKYSPHINLPTCTTPLLLLQVHRHPLLDQREQVWPAGLCLRLLLRPPEGLHQQGGTGKVLHQQVGQGVVVVGARLCLCSRVFVIRHMSCMYHICANVRYVRTYVCMYISM